MVLMYVNKAGEETYYSQYTPYGGYDLLDQSSISVWHTPADPLEELIKKESADPESSPESIPQYDALEAKYLYAFKPKDRAVLRLHFAGYSQIYIADKLNLTQSTVAQLLIRLKKCLKMLADIDPFDNHDLLDIEVILRGLIKVPTYKGRSPDIPDKCDRYMTILKEFSKNCNQNETADILGIRQCSIRGALYRMQKKLQSGGYNRYANKINDLMALSKLGIWGQPGWSDERRKKIGVTKLGNSYAHSANVAKRSLSNRQPLVQEEGWFLKLPTPCGSWTHKERNLGCDLALTAEVGE